MRNRIRIHLVAAIACIVAAGAAGFVVRWSALSPDIYKLDEQSSYGQDLAWDSCGLSYGETGARYLGPNGQTIYAVRYDYESPAVATRELQERLAGRAPTGERWRVRGCEHTNDAIIVEFDTPYPLSGELDARRLPLYAVTRVSGPSIQVVYGPTRDAVLAFQSVGLAPWVSSAAPN